MNKIKKNQCHKNEDEPVRLFLNFEDETLKHKYSSHTLFTPKYRAERNETI